MNESGLKKKCLNAIKKENLKNFWFYCPMDQQRAGVPDILFCANGQFGFVELKLTHGRVSRIQEYTHQKIKEANGKGAVCRTVEEFIEFVKSFYPPKKEN